MKYLLVAAAAIVRHEYERKYRRMYVEATGITKFTPFSFMIRALVKAKQIDISRRAKLLDRYRWLSEMMHAT